MGELSNSRILITGGWISQSTFTKALEKYDLKNFFIRYQS